MLPLVPHYTLDQPSFGYFVGRGAGFSPRCTPPVDLVVEGSLALVLVAAVEEAEELEDEQGR